VRIYRLERLEKRRAGRETYDYGDGKDEENMSGDARKGKAMSARVAF
jgi:hypothetical protein